MNDRVLVLGGGLLQVPLIKKSREKGFEVFLSDYYPDPPGKKYCSAFRQVSTFSIEDNYRYALEEGINYIMTIGTDQPVYTAAAVSERLGLSHPISEIAGQMVTNKYYMKTRMVETNIPTPDFRVFSSFTDLHLDGMEFPLVMKPVDSQGQRGIFVLNGNENKDKLEHLFALSKQCSAVGSVILEEFYPGEEITVNSWVKNGQAHNLLITDRLHFDDDIALGICKQQRYPSEAIKGCEQEIDNVVRRLVDSFGIVDGPLYIQMVIGKKGPQFVEFGYRIGGGFESEIIPRVSGVDILDLYIDLVTTGENFFDPAQIVAKARLGSIFFLFARPGIAKKIMMPGDFYKNNGRLFIKEGETLGEIENATSRIGCFDFYTNEPGEYDRFIAAVDSEIRVLNNEDNDLLIHHIWE